MTFKFAYLKLTAFYILIVMIISIGFSISLFKISSNEINRGLGQQTNILRNLPFNDRMVPNFDQIRKDQLGQSNVHLKINLIYFNLLILVLSGIISYFLAKKTLKPIEDSMIAQSRFTADASHELRTPLAAMRAEIEVALRDKNLNLNFSKKLLNSNLEEIEKLEVLSVALLKLARIEENTKQKFEIISLEDIITEAFEKVEKLADKKEIEFQVKLKDFKIKGDCQSLVELFVILFDNAIKYSPKKSKIIITMEKDKNHIVVKIKDHGVGIKASDLPYIFNRFYRADMSRSKEQVDGYGLGLSIAEQITKFHKGRIEVTSRPGKGSEFTVKFPV